MPPTKPIYHMEPDTNCAPAALASAMLLHARALSINNLGKVGTFSDGRGLRPWTAGLSLRGTKTLWFCVFPVKVNRSRCCGRTGVPAGEM